MSKEKKQAEPAQLPHILWHEPTKQWGYFEVKVPIGWKDFMGVEKVKAIAVATLNIVDAISVEFQSREAKRKTANDVAREKVTAEAEAKKADEKKAAVEKIIAEEPDAVAAKRKEIGEDVLSEEGAARILYTERQAPPAKPANTPKSAAAKAAPEKPVDAGGYVPPVLTDGEFGTTVRFYKSEYGWSAYLDKGKEDMIPTLFDWLITIPKENRHRKGDKYPCISHSGKYIMCNAYEKLYIETVVKAKGMAVTVKED